MCQEFWKGACMNGFIERHRNRILGVVSGFDRLLFRGTLRSISYLDGLKKFLNARSILLKDFAPFANRCTTQIVAHAEKIAEDAKRPYIYLYSPSIRKEDYARKIAQRDQIEQGLVCVLYAVEPCMSFDIHRNREEKRLQLVSRQRKCRFFYFYFVDREFGLMHIRLQSWIPFEVQVCLNGHSYLAGEMQREGIPFEQRDNAFPFIGDIPRAQRLFDRLTTRNWPKMLSCLSRRVNPLLDGLLREVFDYYWTIRQSEYATDVLFKDRSALHEVYPALCRHAMTHFGSRDVMRFLSGSRGGKLANEVVSQMNERTEGVRIKHRVGENLIKMYDKGGRILRIETIVNNPRSFQVLRKIRRGGQSTLTWQKMRKGVSDTPRRAEISLAANVRYLEALSVVGEETPSHRILDPVSEPVESQGHAYRGLRPISPEESRLFEALMHGEHLLHGFTNRQLRAQLFRAPTTDPRQLRRRSAYVTRRLRLLRAHGLIRKVGRQRLYRITQRGHSVMTTALIFRTTDLALLNHKAA